MRPRSLRRVMAYAEAVTGAVQLRDLPDIVAAAPLRPVRPILVTAVRMW